jgi:hypothetical protein
MLRVPCTCLVGRPKLCILLNGQAPSKVSGEWTWTVTRKPEGFSLTDDYTVSAGDFVRPHESLKEECLLSGETTVPRKQCAEALSLLRQSSAVQSLQRALCCSDSSSPSCAVLREEQAPWP